MNPPRILAGGTRLMVVPFADVENEGWERSFGGMI